MYVTSLTSKWNFVTFDFVTLSNFHNYIGSKIPEILQFNVKII